MCLTNISNQIDLSWKYDSSTNILCHKLSDTKNKLSWLSAKLTIYENEKSHEYDIDQFINTFDVYTTTPPSLMIIFMCWCIYTKQWFSQKCIIEFTIINSLGQERVLTVHNHNHSITLYGNKLM
jgi:hypothetical protein